jgi:hypothetical protein
MLHRQCMTNHTVSGSPGQILWQEFRREFKKIRKSCYIKNIDSQSLILYTIAVFNINFQGW